MIGKIENVPDNRIITFTDIYLIDLIMKEYEEEHLWIKIYAEFLDIDKCRVLIIAKSLIERINWRVVVH